MKQIIIKLRRYVLRHVTGLSLFTVILLVLGYWQCVVFVKMSKDSKPIVDTTKGISTCAPVRKLIFAKTHKTGSTTLQNLMFRYGTQNNLTFVLPNSKWWFFNHYRLFKASDAEGFNNTNISSEAKDIFAIHSVWNHYEVRKILPNAPAVTILRDPIDVFESAYSYFGNNPKDINEFVKANKDLPLGKIKVQKPMPLMNQLMHDLGLFKANTKNEEAIKDKISKLDRQFDLVMIAEEMDKSLLLLHKLTCWPLKAFTYLSLNQRKESFKNNISPESREVLKRWLFPDYMLYNYFREKFEEKMNTEVDFINSNLPKLQLENEKVYSDCVISKTDNKNGLKGDFRMWSQNSLGYKINEDNFWCRYYAISEMAYTKIIRKLQKK